MRMKNCPFQTTAKQTRKRSHSQETDAFEIREWTAHSKHVFKLTLRVCLLQQIIFCPKRKSAPTSASTRVKSLPWAKLSNTALLTALVLLFKLWNRQHYCINRKSPHRQDSVNDSLPSLMQLSVPVHFCILIFSREANIAEVMDSPVADYCTIKVNKSAILRAAGMQPSVHLCTDIYVIR